MFKVKYSHRQKERSKDNAKSWGQPTHTLPRKSWPKLNVNEPKLKQKTL